MHLHKNHSLIVVLCSSITVLSAQKFDPYQLNGGLVAAVAGKDYVLIASDTRLTDGGYGINSRRYLSGRIWKASSSTLLQSLQGGRVSEKSAWNFGPAEWEPDGSLSMPPSARIGAQPSNSLPDKHEIGILSPHSIKGCALSNSQLNLPVLIGSAGCASDCESLKRRFRVELNALESNFSSEKTLGVQSIANLLQQVLYGRRGFPFYSFCVVAGIDNRDSDGTGAVYVYDAIGSFERVAVGCNGTGRELLQPILDRLFSESSNGTNNKQINCGANGDVMSIPAGEQRFGVAGSLRPPVRTTVDCSWEEAVYNVARGFQAVAEREISVGDEIVLCLLRTQLSENHPSMNVINYKLKKH